jgi:hypothetical protein
MDYVALKAEIDGDPLARGYSGMTDQQIADDLNTVYRTRNRTSATGKQIKDQIQTADWASRSDAQKNQLLALFARDDLDPFGIDADIFTEAMSGHAGTTVADLNTWRVENISRAEEIGAAGVNVAAIESARALV